VQTGTVGSYDAQPVTEMVSDSGLATSGLMPSTEASRGAVAGPPHASPVSATQATNANG